MAREHDVCAAEDISIGALTPVKVGRATVVVTRLPTGTLKAVSGRCPHHGAPLEYGCVTGLIEAKGSGITVTRPGEVLRCPWHGFEFDLETGEPVVNPPQARAMRLRIFNVTERDGRVVVSI